MKTIIDWVKTIGVKGWIVFIALVISCCCADAQSFKLEGKTYSSTNIGSIDSEITTEYFYKLGDTSYQICLSKNGRAYIWLTSSKTGKQYKKYLGEDISRDICKKMGIEYKEKNS